jgi:carboxyl-terminal processing protease
LSSNKKYFIILPIVFALLIVLGIFIGYYFSFSDTANDSATRKRSSKLDKLITYVKNRYVDTVNVDQLEEKALSTFMQNLDPHSAYITAKEAKAMNEPLQGNFGGIGVEFNILKDTIRVVSAIAGGPSEALGIQAGDMIVKVEGKNVAGVKITNQQVIDKLRGESGTKVKVSIKRRGVIQLTDYVITRGEIPIYSIETAYMATSTIGYIKISRFSATTFEEYLNAFDKLKSKGMSKLVLDLRGNPGGYLDAAVKLSDEFLPRGQKIVYTEGRMQPKQEYNATQKGNFEREKLVILIDEGSASASEIVAGAVQDNDRGTIVGRRSFGKGLVQEQKEFTDGSSVRLTIARYYTPTGRCIQKPYSEGIDAYNSEEYERFEHGELQNADSIKFSDSLKYKTPAGKIVYGGGGIMPDVFVPLDTSGRSPFLSELIYTGTLNQFAFDYADKNRKQLKANNSAITFNKQFVINENVLNDFYAFAKKNGVKTPSTEGKKSETIIKTQLKALIARNLFGNDGYYPVVQQNDKAFKKALELLEK